MTILAFDNGVLYTDSFILLQNGLASNCATYGEKVFRDPDNRFILAVNGEQPWNAESRLNANFEKNMACIIASILNFENTGKWIEHPSKNKSVETDMGYNGFLMTRKNCYRLAKNFLPRVEKAVGVVGLNNGAFSLLHYAGYPTKKALEIIGTYGGGTSGTIHEYKQSSLKSFK